MWDAECVVEPTGKWEERWLSCQSVLRVANEAACGGKALRGTPQHSTHMGANVTESDHASSKMLTWGENCDTKRVIEGAGIVRKFSEHNRSIQIQGELIKREMMDDVGFARDCRIVTSIMALMWRFDHGRSK